MNVCGYNVAPGTARRLLGHRETAGDGEGFMIGTVLVLIGAAGAAAYALFRGRK